MTLAAALLITGILFFATPLLLVARVRVIDPDDDRVVASARMGLILLIIGIILLIGNGFLLALSSVIKP